MSEDIADTLRESISELSQRWEKAREAAISFLNIQTLRTEKDFKEINQISEELFEELLKKVFLNSRNLGISYQRKYNITWEREEFIAWVGQMGSSCFVGKWEKKNMASSLSRSGCKGGALLGPRFCQYWREAVDGLTMGISDNVRFVRHGSTPVGDEKCIDIFFEDEAATDAGLWKNQQRWGALPEEMSDGLKSIQDKFLRLKVSIAFLGVAEKKLFYKLESKENLTCGTSGKIFRNLLEKHVAEVFPGILLQDASPVAVYGGET